VPFHRVDNRIEAVRIGTALPVRDVASSGERKCNVSEIRKLIPRWHCDELGAEKAARWKCSKALAPILDVIRKYAVHASLKAVDASRECPA
jgi:hypothetical protein